MTRCLLFLLVILVSAGVVPGQSPAPKLTLQYFFDRDDEELRLFDIRFLTPKRGLAAGFLQSESRNRGVLLESNDGGVTWQQIPFKEIPRSLSFLNESLGWIVSDSGIWATEEGGRSWKKIRSQRGLLQVHFVDPENGFAIGAERTFLRTTDAGKTWTKVAEAESASANPDLIYSVAAFANAKQGIVAGFAPVSRRGPQLPAWMEPEEAARRGQRPGVIALLNTADGGRTWQPQIGSAFGRISALAVRPNRFGLALIQFDDTFEYPGEVFRLTGSASSERVFREKDRLMTAVAFDAQGQAWMGGIEPPLKIRGAAIPGPVKLYRGTAPQYNLWQAIPVDYRANANQVALAIGPDGTVWVATDTGMILRLAPNSP